MAVLREFRSDLDTILDQRHANGADFWATPDGRWGTGSPFSTFDCILHLTELGVAKKDPVLRGAAEVVLATWRDDGRFRPAPKSAMYACHTANALRVLCRAGFARDRRVRRSFEYLLETQHDDGGWRCTTVKLGKSPETDASNPGVTLAALDAFRFTDRVGERSLERAVQTLLSHWNTREPLGPCHFGIGTLFGKTEYPFLRYNLFFYVYVLSFYPSAHRKRAFRAALKRLEEKLEDGALVVENPNRRLARLAFYRKGAPSQAATRRFREIVKNLDA